MKSDIMKIKITIFTILLVSMISYIVWIFYMSEPEYIDNPQNNKVEKYDIVSIRPFGNIEFDLELGMVIQIDTTIPNKHSAIIKSIQWNNTYKDIQLDTATPSYKIIGKGTFYHKINYLIGFNIMMTTIFLVAILAIVISVTLINLLQKILGFKSDDWYP